VRTRRHTKSAGEAHLRDPWRVTMPDRCPPLAAAGASSRLDYRYFAGRIIARHIWATALLSKPRPCSG
jgi:hypothetical protein